jgi:hypothetical protein
MAKQILEYVILYNEVDREYITSDFKMFLERLAKHKKYNELNLIEVMYSKIWLKNSKGHFDETDVEIYDIEDFEEELKAFN